MFKTFPGLELISVLQGALKVVILELYEGIKWMVTRAPALL